MLKRLPLVVMFATAYVLPAFADITSESRCTSETFNGISEGTVNIEARWTPKVFSCAAGMYLNAATAECDTCPAGKYCGGVTDSTFDDSNQGIDGDCPTGYTEGTGVSSENNCYVSGTINCAEYNPYTGGHGTANYANATAAYKEYYSGGEGVKQLDDDNACDITSLNCDEHYREEGGVCVRDAVTCPAGSYLPNGATSCELCRWTDADHPGIEDHYCPGGEFDIGYDGDQGAFACPDGLRAPAGSQVPEDCGRLLHVKDTVVHLHSDKRTTPSLTVKVDGVTYYADMTPVDELDTTMNPKTEEKLRVKVGGVEYYVHEPEYVYPPNP